MATRLSMHRALASFAFLALVLGACGGTPTATVAPINTAPSATSAGLPSTAPTAPAATSGAASGAASGPLSALQATFCEPWTTDIVNHWPPFEVLEAEAMTDDLKTWAADPAFAAVSADMQTVIDYVDFVMRGGHMVPPTAEDEAAFSRINAFATANC